MNTKAIYALYPDVVTIREQEDGSVLCYDAKEELVEITIDQTLVDAWVDPNAYKEARALTYAPLAEQLDMQYHDTMNGTTTWKDHIASVKEAHPKEGE